VAALAAVGASSARLDIDGGGCYSPHRYQRDWLLMAEVVIFSLIIAISVTNPTPEGRRVRALMR
jgi:hypothetical protein